MRNTGLRDFISVFIFGAVLFMVGCVSDPVQTYLPANRPANPEAAETVYTAPPNPFKDTLPMDEMKSTETPSMSPKGHEDSPSHKMKPGHDTGHKNHEKSMDTTTKKSDRQHQEHD